MKNGLWVVSLLLVCFVALGCTEEAEADGPDACRNYIDTVAKKVEECTGAPYERTYEELEDAVSPEEGCEAVIGVKHDDEFFDSCLPGIRDTVCTEFNTGSFPESCEGQLVIF